MREGTVILGGGFRSVGKFFHHTAAMPLLARPIPERHRPQQCIVERVDAARAEDDVSSELREMADVQAGAFAAHQLDEVLLVGVHEMMRDAGRVKPMKSPGPTS